MSADVTLAPLTMCASCGYDLRAQAHSSLCPECAMPVSASIAHFAVPHDSATRDYIHAALATFAVCIVLTTACLVVGGPLGPRRSGNSFRSKQVVAQSESRAILFVVTAWLADHDLAALPPDFTLLQLTEGAHPHLRTRDLLDPWNRAYLLIRRTDDSFCVITLGADGSVGGQGGDADLITD